MRPRLVPVPVLLAAALALQGMESAGQSHAGPASRAAMHPGAAPQPDAKKQRARAVLYPAYDEATMLTGESFRSPSLGREAPDMLLRDFDLQAAPGSSLHVAAALLKPTGFPASYTLVEVAVLQENAGGRLQLLKNLKVRVDSGTGSGEVQMRLARVARRDPAHASFDVVVTADGQSLRHRFRHDDARLVLVESVLVQ